MNNHKIYTQVENNIEYHILSYRLDNEKDIDYISNFTEKYKYTKTIELDFTSVLHTNPNYPLVCVPVSINCICYFKNGKKHNIYGPAEIHTNDENMNIRFYDEFYYLNDEGMKKEKWIAKTRKNKIEKILNKFGK